MESRLELQAMLEDILGSHNVYFQPPTSVEMEYDAIVYRRKNIGNTFANDSVYKQDHAYELIVIYRDPDSDIPIKISKLPRCNHDRQYVSDNLIHDVFKLYY